MKRCWLLAALAVVVLAVPASAAGLTGLYVEARNCDVWAAPCFANAETSLAGKNAVLGWKVEKGSVDNVALDGLGIVAVVAAGNTLGMEQYQAARVLLIVDEKASPAQRAALVKMARTQGGDLLKNVVDVQSAPVELVSCECKEGGCYRLKAGSAHVLTRCLNVNHDKVCGNEHAFYPPLTRDVKVQAAVAVEHGFSGKGLDQTWNETERRGVYVGSFELR
jgi:hypothetical protein